MYGSTAAVTIAGDAVINGTNGMAIRSQSGKLTVNGTVNANGERLYRRKRRCKRWQC